MRAWLGLLAFTLAFFGALASARADVVDEAYAAGNDAAASGDWAGAVAHYERAVQHLPGRSSVLEHDLGLAHAHAGDLGRATFHLQRSLQPDAQPDARVAESARRNLGLVRRRVEIAAQSAGNRVSPDTSWLEIVSGGLAGEVAGLLVLLAGLAALAAAGVGVWDRRRGGRSRAWPWAVAGIGALVFALGAPLHELSVRQQVDEPDAIVLAGEAEILEGPGLHRSAAFTLQGGSRVRVVERSGAWRKVRLSDGLEGWVQNDALGLLRDP